MSPPRRISLLRRCVLGGAWATAAAAVAVAATAFWLLATASGAQFVFDRAAAFAGGRVGVVEGRLVGPLALEAIEIASPGLRVRARQVAFDWSPLRLLGSELRVVRLQAALLEISTAASSDPLREPATLALPLRLFVEQARVERLRVGTIGDDAGGVEFLDVSAKLAADRAAWILGGLEAMTPIGRAKAAGTLAASAPFALDVKGELAGTRNGAGYRATVAAKGTLAKLEVTLAASEGGLSGTGSAMLEPFASVPLRKLSAKLHGVDLAAFFASSHTMLAVEADLAPSKDAILAGTVKVANTAIGPLDQQRLPIASATAQLAIERNRIEAKKLALSFSGGGRAEGQAVWAGGNLDASLAVKDLDLLAWHSSLKATKLAGTLTAVATAEAQSFGVALADPRFEIRGDARIADGRLTVERVRLARGAAFAQASGSLDLRGGREFQASGRIERLDPAAFANVPAGDVNASFAAKGNLAKGPVGEVTLEIAKSRFAGLAAVGRVAIVTDGARLSRTEADVSLGATRLVAAGALGRAGDSLEVKLASPDLAPLGRAFGLVLGGRVDLDARVSGEFTALSGHAWLDATDLALPGAIRVAKVTSRIELGSGDQGAANGHVDLRGVARGADKEALVESVVLEIKGTRSSHEIRVESAFPDKFSVRALLDGGIVPGARLPEWRGRLESLDIAGRTAFALSAPATLVAGADRIELGEAVFVGEPGQVRLAVTSWTPAGIQTRGSSSALVIRTIRQILNVQGEVGSSLVLAGDWDLRIGETVDGFVSIRRDRGDVRVGEPRVGLGLETLALRADASAGRVKATADIRGTQAGQWKAEASVTLRRGDEGWEVSPVAPVEGHFTVDVPDLAWTAAWIGPEARVRGRLAGEGTLAGTLREPTWSGRLEATGLAVREPTLGAEVADGTIAILLKDREARIERFTLSMPWQPSEEAARAISAVKYPATGTVTAEGAIDLGTRKGTIRVKALGYPLTRLATRFLAVSGEGRAELDGNSTVMTGEFTADAGWFGIPGSAPPSLSDDVIVIRGSQAPLVARDAEHTRMDLRVNLGEHLHFRGRGLSTRLAGSLRLAGELGVNLRTTGTIRAVGGTYDAYGRTLTLERGALNFQGPVDNPGINILALRKGLAVEAGVEVLGTVARPKVRLVSSPEVPEAEKLAWLVLGRGRGDVSAADAATLVGAASTLLGEGALPTAKLIGGLGLDEVSVGSGLAWGPRGTAPEHHRGTDRRNVGSRGGHRGQAPLRRYPCVLPPGPGGCGRIAECGLATHAKPAAHPARRLPSRCGYRLPLHLRLKTPGDRPSRPFGRHA
ncbi:MAG: translocation/assembly module TamB domain-containing protein [Betaproteobacteria bacterium]|nr:translocation/assembly module TamB domain-containing protein [Betaproteobacteria bacterium]